VNYVQIGFLKEAFDAKELRVGTRIEHEHTKSKTLAKKIAKDHLREIPNYYKRLLPLVEHKKYAQAYFADTKSLDPGTIQAEDALKKPIKQPVETDPEDPDLMKKSNRILRTNDHVSVDHSENKNLFLSPKLDPLVRRERVEPTFSGLAEDPEKIAYTLQPHQERVNQRLKKQDRLLVYHKPGSGKTLTALSAADRMNEGLSIIGPAALRSNFPKEQLKHHTNVPTKIYTYNKPPVGEQPGIVAFDESHNMGDLTSLRSHYPDMIKGKKTLFLTGSPIRNRPDELIPLMRGLGSNFGRNKKSFNEAFIRNVKENPNFFARIFKGVKPGLIQKAQNLDVLKKALKGKVDYYEPTHDGYPSVTSEDIKVKFSGEQNAAYQMAQKGKPSLAYKVMKGISPSKAESKDMNAFLSASRTISLMPGEFNMKASVHDAPKIMRATEEIKKFISKDPNYRGVTYSNFITHGINPLRSLLDKAGISYGVFTGHETPKQKKETIEAFNRGELKQLLISKAGGEGIDLKGVRLVQVLDPTWHEAGLKQLTHRAIRFQSHAHLSPSEQNVHIQHYFAEPPDKKFLFFKRKGGMGSDEYMKMLAHRKEELNRQFLKVLKDVGTEKP
jgi:superfamily II DNA or RNA helicase